jgi:sulfur-oxidizing protein SoxY
MRLEHVTDRESRRRAIRLLGGTVCLAAGIDWSGALAAVTGDVHADEGAAFAAGSLEEVLTALGATRAESAQLDLTVPDLTENGAVVPVEIVSRITGPQDIYIIVQDNPFPLVARFVIPDGTEPFVATRIKVAQSCDIHVLVQAGGRFYAASKPTKVTLGGCGA